MKRKEKCLFLCNIQRKIIRCTVNGLKSSTSSSVMLSYLLREYLKKILICGKLIVYFFVFDTYSPLILLVKFKNFFDNLLNIFP